MAAKSKTRAKSASEPERRDAAVAEGVSPSAPKRGDDLGLKLLVFVAGAVLMGLEIVGSRLLAPYFGNSVFVWGSLISLFLIALSAGYYFGGRVADRHPSRALLNSIVIAVAAAMFAIVGLAGPVCNEIVNQRLGEKAGPFAASVVLFLLPSIGMGMASPFAVRLAAHNVLSVGKTAGTLYALSTIGSIAGTMLTTFVLIPIMGASDILKGLAAALLVVAVTTYPFAGRLAAAAAVLLAGFFAAACIFGIDSSSVSLALGSVVVVDADTPYHHITVIDDSTDGSRQLRFDQYIESAIEKDPPHRSLSAYTQYFHLAFLPKPAIRRALFIGAGGGVGPRAFHMHDPAMEIEVVDIDAKVLELAETHFHLPATRKIQLAAADGRMYVRSATPSSYDCIILDAFSIGGRIPFHLVTREFLELCREKLTPGGVFLMNINSALEGPKAQIYQSMYKTLKAAFPDNAHTFFVQRAYASPRDSRNVILVGVNEAAPFTLEDWRASAARYESRSYVDRRAVAQMMDDLVVNPPIVEDASPFTDDYAPIETMPF